MSRIIHPLQRACTAALLVLALGVPLIVVGTLLWSVNALLGIATWEKVGYELGYHGTWLIILALAAGGAGLAWGVIEVLGGRQAR